MNTTVPERLLIQLARSGIAAIVDDLAVSAPGSTVLDSILATLSTEERAKARQMWTTNPPTAIMGFARKDAPWPLWALILTDESIDADYLGMGEEALLDEDDETAGFLFKRRVQGSFTWYCFAEHPDWCAYNYRVLRRIMNVGIRSLLANNIQALSLQGSDMAPAPEYGAENVFMRRLTVTCQYEEDWTDRDALWLALNGDPEALAHAIEVDHEDALNPQGGVHPITE